MVEEIEKQVSITPSDKLLIKGKQTGALRRQRGFLMQPGSWCKNQALSWAVRDAWGGEGCMFKAEDMKVGGVFKESQESGQEGIQ